MTGDAVDHGVGGRKTRRDLVVAGLAQHDPGDRRLLAVDPADGPEGEAAAGRVVLLGHNGFVGVKTGSDAAHAVGLDVAQARLARGARASR